MVSYKTLNTTIVNIFRCKDNANQEQYKPNLFGFIAKMQLILLQRYTKLVYNENKLCFSSFSQL